jgi:hypothetical protein
VRRAVEEHAAARAGQEPRRVPPTRPRAASPTAVARPTHPQPPTRGPHRAPGPQGHRPPDATGTQRGRHEPLRGPRRPLSPLFFCSPIVPSLCEKGAAARRKPRVFLTPHPDASPPSSGAFSFEVRLSLPLCPLSVWLGVWTRRD